MKVIKILPLKKAHLVRISQLPIKQEMSMFIVILLFNLTIIIPLIKARMIGIESVLQKRQALMTRIH
jgi:hypothetical protein